MQAVRSLYCHIVTTLKYTTVNSLQNCPFWIINYKLIDNFCFTQLGLIAMNHKAPLVEHLTRDLGCPDLIPSLVCSSRSYRYSFHRLTLVPQIMEGTSESEQRLVRSPTSKWHLWNEGWSMVCLDYPTDMTAMKKIKMSKNARYISADLHLVILLVH